MYWLDRDNVDSPTKTWNKNRKKVKKKEKTVVYWLDRDNVDSPTKTWNKNREKVEKIKKKGHVLIRQRERW